MAVSAVRPRVIYDFGANNGDDLPYYLSKADVVVAVEANPALAEQIAGRFVEDIRHGRLFVENCVLLAGPDQSDPVPFFVHRSNHVLSQFPRPNEAERSEFDEALLPARSVAGIIGQYGAPYYIKIDIEHYDQFILEALFARGIRPQFISAEAHRAEIFELMAGAGGYRSFNLVNGGTVSTVYPDHLIRTRAGLRLHSFPHHSAGPFGDDLSAAWMTPEVFRKRLARVGLGWIDIHASASIEPDIAVTPLLELRLSWADWIAKLRSRVARLWVRRL